MSVITISRGAFSRGKEVAERVARELGYECISREVLLETSEDFNIPEIKLARAIHDAPSVLERFTYGKEKYIAYIRATLLGHMKKDNVVYHGLAGHFFVQNIPHVFKVRVFADFDYRVKEEMEREGISKEEARNLLRKDDYERRKWGLQLYGQDTWDANLYDLVVHVKSKSVDDIVKIVLHAARLKCFQTTPESQKIMVDLSLAADVKAALVDTYPTAETSAADGVVLVKVEASLVHEEQITQKIKRIVLEVPGVEEVRVHIIPFTLYTTK